MHGEQTSRPIDQTLHLHQAELIQPICPHIDRVLVFHQQIRQTTIESRCCRNVFGVLVALENINVGSDCVFERQVDHLAHAYCAGPTNQTDESRIDAQIIEQTHCDLQSRSSCSLFFLIPGDFVTIRAQRIHCRLQPSKVIIIERDVVSRSDDFVDEFGIQDSRQP